jgi:hypothetical protein
MTTLKERLLKATEFDETIPLDCGLTWGTDSHAQVLTGAEIQYERLKPILNLLPEMATALEEIAKDFGTDACDGNTMIAHEALTKLNEAVETYD